MSETDSAPEVATMSARDELIRDDERRQHPVVVLAELARSWDEALLAEQLLALSDYEVMAFGVRMAEICTDKGFQLGADYLALRLAFHFRRRSREGFASRDTRDSLDMLKLALIKLVKR